MGLRHKVKPLVVAGFLFSLLLLGLMWLPAPAFAQAPFNTPEQTVNWQELKTEKFLIVYADSVSAEGRPVDCVCGLAEAEQYAAFIDQIYNDEAQVFKTELKTPINLRLFPTEETYYEVNPLAEQLTGVIAHALNNRQEIAVALPRTAGLNEDEIINNLRHELAHLFASQLSGGKLKAGFQEGVAQYMEKPGSSRDSFNPALLRQAFEQGRLLTWAELDEAKRVYSDPQVAYPQTLSVVSFLVDRYGLPPLFDFIRATATAPGYRSALETAYGQPADALEAEWLAYLPQYFDGRWQINALYSYDLSRVTALVEKGAYSGAEAELTDIIGLLESTNQAETLAQAEALLARARQGQAAAALADEARAALITGNYPLVIAKGNAAIAAYEAIGYWERIHEIQTYVYRAGLGQEALAHLSEGERLLDSFRFYEAENEVYEATALLQSLNNQVAVERGQALLRESARRQGLVAYAMLGVGLALFLWNGLRRIINRLSAHPLEVEFT